MIGSSFIEGFKEDKTNHIENVLEAYQAFRDHLEGLPKKWVMELLEELYEDFGRPDELPKTIMDGSLDKDEGRQAGPTLPEPAIGPLNDRILYEGVAEAIIDLLSELKYGATCKDIRQCLKDKYRTTSNNHQKCVNDALARLKQMGKIRLDDGSRVYFITDKGRKK